MIPTFTATCWAASDRSAVVMSHVFTRKGVKVAFVSRVSLSRLPLNPFSSTQNQILATQASVFTLPRHFMLRFWKQRGTGQGGRFEVSWAGPLPFNLHPISKTEWNPPPLLVTHPSSHPNLKPFMFQFCFFQQCNPESTLPCYSFVWTCEWWFVTELLNM